MKFQLYQSDKNKEYYFRLVANNGENILRSEGYTTKDSAQNGISSVRKNCADSSMYERKEGAGGKFHFNLKAGNGQVIGSSQMYTSKNGMEGGIDAVSRATDADIEDIS